MINAIENNTEVVTPSGHKGYVSVTRRERKLMASGKLNEVDVLGTDGEIRKFCLGDLKVVETSDDIDNETLACWLEETLFLTDVSLLPNAKENLSKAAKLIKEI